MGKISSSPLSDSVANGELYFYVSHQGDSKLVRLQADCILNEAVCADVKEELGEVSESAMMPLSWSLQGDRALMVTYLNELEINRLSLFDLYKDSWQMLTEVQGHVLGMAWRTDEAKFAFATSRISENFIVQMENADVEKIARESGRKIELVWLGKGKLVYANQDAGDSEIYLMDNYSQAVINLKQYLG